jgi:hypothetical protein
MRTLVSVAALLAVLALCLSAYVHATLPPFPAPAVFWSNQGIFPAKQEQCVASLSERDIAALVSSIATGSAASQDVLSRYIDASAQRPEVVVVFLEQQSGTTREAYSFLKTFLDSAASSLVLPYVYPEAPLSVAISEKASQAVVLDGITSSESVLAHFDSAILSNGKTDVVIVHVARGDASLIATIQQRISGSNFVLGYAADTNFQSPVQAVRIVGRSTVDSGVVVVQDNYADGDYWPADVWSGIVSSVALLIILAVGIGCLFELQTPTKFEKPKRNLRDIN